MVVGQDFLALGLSSRHSRPLFVFFFAISLLVYQLFRQMNGYCIRPSCLAAFSPGRILILAVPLASFSGGHLGLIKYHQSRVPLYGAPTACMTMQLVRHSSLELLIHSGGVQLNSGPDTGSNPVRSAFCIHRPLQCTWAVKALILNKLNQTFLLFRKHI